MIEGRVRRDRAATVVVNLLNDHGEVTPVEVIVDTGFTGDLTLPTDLISRLGLSFVGRGEAIVGDGAIDLFDVYAATVEWDGKPRRIEVDAVRNEPLLGMGLMQGYRLTVDVRDDGSVSLTRLDD
jgi:clan AA aspartic protease